MKPGYSKAGMMSEFLSAALVSLMIAIFTVLFLSFRFDKTTVQKLINQILTLPAVRELQTMPKSPMPGL